MSILKAIGDFFVSLSGLNREDFKNNDSIQSIGNTINDVSRDLKGKAIFQTKKEKERAEQEAQNRMQRDVHNTAESMGEIAETLKEIREMLERSL